MVVVMIKRAQFFNFIEFKKANFILLQETHSDSSNEAHWLSEWKGKAILSHGSNVSAGLAVLFSGARSRRGVCRGSCTRESFKN